QDPLRDHLDGQEDRYVGTSFRMQMVLEQPPYDRKVTQQRNFGHLLDFFISDKAADHYRVAVLNADDRLGFARASLRKPCREAADCAYHGMDAEGYVAVVIHPWVDKKHDTHRNFDYRELVARIRPGNCQRLEPQRVSDEYGGVLVVDNRDLRA